MYKYTGDSIINASLTVKVPKPLDNRTVVNNILELYSIPPAYAYVGMTVANIDNGNIYMLTDKSKINEKAGWKASYESIQILTCTEAEYKEWLENTDERFQPIDQLKEYIHQDTYYYIYEDSLSAESELQEYVRRSDWVEVLNTLSGKASNDGLARTNNIVLNIIETYATKLHVADNYAPLTMFDLEDEESFIRDNFFTKAESLEKFVKFSDLTGDEIGEGDFIFVTAARYEEDLADLDTYKQGIADELAQCLKVGDDGELDSIVVSHIKSKKVNNKQLVVDVTPDGMSVNGDPIAKISDIPPHVTLTRAEYELLVANNEVDEDTYYHITNDDDTYVLESELVNYYTIAGVQSYIAGRTYTKAQVDEIISGLSFNTPEEIADVYVTKTSLADTLEDYVTIAMLGGEEGDEGTFIFVKQSDYNEYVAVVAQLRLQDLQDIDDTYLRKNQDGTLGDITAESIITTVITDGTNILSIGEVLQLNGDDIALVKDVPRLVTLTKSEYQALVENDEVEEDVYYHITDDTDSYVLSSQLSDYYTKAGIESYIAGRNYTKTEVDNLIARLSGYYTREDVDDLFVSNNALLETLADYVTIAMLGGDDMEGQFIFVKASDYADDQQALATQREQDLQQIDDDYVKKNSDATLNSLETTTIKNGLNILLLSDILKLNNKKLALEEDVPVIQVVTAEEYELLTKNPNIYYFVYNTDPELGFVTSQELSNYYTKAQIDSKLVALVNGQTPSDSLITQSLLDETLEDYATPLDIDDKIGHVAKVESVLYDYIHDEESWNNSFQNGALKKYYTRWPDEDRYNLQEHRWAWAIDKIDGEWPDYCVQCWEGAVNADGAKFPWICPNFETDVNSRIIFSYDGKDVLPWEYVVFGKGNGHKEWGIASIPELFKNNGFLITANLNNGNPDWEGTPGDNNFNISKFKMYLYVQDADNTAKGYVDLQVKYLLSVIDDLRSEINALKNA